MSKLTAKNGNTFIVRMVYDKYNPTIENAVIRDMIGLSAQYPEYTVYIQDPQGKLFEIANRFKFNLAADTEDNELDLQIVYTVTDQYPYELAKSDWEVPDTIHRDFFRKREQQTLDTVDNGFRTIPVDNSIPIRPQEPLHQPFQRPSRNAPHGLDPVTLLLWGSKKKDSK